MGTKGFLLVDLKGLKENSKGEELFLVGGLMLFGGWHAPKRGSGEPLNVIYAVQTVYAPSLTNTYDSAPSCAGYSVPMKDCVGGRRGGGFWVTLPVLWGSLWVHHDLPSLHSTCRLQTSNVCPSGASTQSAGLPLERGAPRQKSLPSFVQCSAGPQPLQ